MWMKRSASVLILLAATQPAAAQQATGQNAGPNPMVLAQALDRCMTTQAVRLTHTAATDADIYAQARRSCLSLNGRLRASITAQVPPADAAEVLRTIDAQAEPSFMALLARIRSDRAQRSAE